MAYGDQNEQGGYDYERGRDDREEAVEAEFGGVVIRHSQAIGNIAAALAAAQAEFGSAELDRTNSHLGSQYATLGSLKRASRPQLGKHGIAVVQAPKTLGNGMVQVETMLIHGSGEWLAADLTAKTVDQRGLISLQMLGVVIAYLKRYLYSSLVGIEAASDTDDDDGQSLAAAGGPPAQRGGGGGSQSSGSGNGGSAPGGQFLGALKAFESNAKVTCGEKTVAGVLAVYAEILAAAQNPDALKAAASLIGKFEAIERRDQDAQAVVSGMRKAFAERTKTNGGVAARVAAAKPNHIDKPAPPSGKPGSLHVACIKCGGPIEPSSEGICAPCKAE